MLDRYVQSQNTLRPLSDEANLAKYYDIYDIALDDLEVIEASLSHRNMDDQYSLRSLRDLFGKLYSMRKSVLCCLLALSADGGGSDITRWSAAVEEMRELAAVTGLSMTKMSNILNEEDSEFPPLHFYPDLRLIFRRGYNSSISSALDLSKQGAHARAIPATQLLVTRRPILACKDAHYMRGDQCHYGPL
jgi:hypothetical protein